MPNPQSYERHKRYVVGYHVVTFVLLLVLFVWSVRQLIRDPSLTNVMLLVAVVALQMLFGYARAFALSVQNRVIRLEEQLRMARLLPDDLKPRIGELRMSQLIALRFASDGELSDLVRRVLGGELADQDAIKRAIKEWRPDYARA